ncbi:MAG: cadherin-like beta sandwich domain-containing protein [Bacilli bacterium]|nr:cadherin-like beta sandwich domain-containing protein [Bacilli bacterium]
MKKYIKIFSLVITLFLSIFLLNTSIKAASATISVKSNNSVVVGNTVKVTVTLSSSSSLGSWDFSIGYDTSLLRLTSSTAESGQRSVGYVSGKGQTSKTYTFNFKALKSGTAKVYVNNAEVYAFDESLMSVSKGSKSISIKTQAEIEASYSKNNYLKSLSVDGCELSPSFDKETSEYTVELDSTVESIKVNASVEDSTASLIGGGEVSVVEGSNSIELVVTAQNGNTRTYKIIANVKEVNPINVEVDNKKYTVVKRKSALSAPDNFKETTVVINNEEIPAFYNEITDYTVVGLKDEKGIVELFIYDLDSGKYTKYQELNFNSNKIFLLDAVNIPNGLKETTIKINEKEIKAYKFDDNSIYYIVYGINLNTGNKDFYMYDSEEYTIQRYDTTMIDKLTKEKDRYLSIVLVLSCVCFLSMLFLLIEVNKYNKIKNEI